MKISTVFILVGMLILSLYVLIEVNYYAAADTIIKNQSDVPYLEIPAIGVNESINNKSVSYGIYHEPQSSKPGRGTVIIFGHRTLYGSPFLNLDKLKNGDNITLIWPEIGNAEYTVNDSFIVPASYQMSVEQGNSLFLITCYPLGSTKERYIVQAKLDRITPITNKTAHENPKAYYAPLLIVAFFGGGLVINYIYPVEEDKKIIFVAVIALTLFLICGYLFPIPADYISNRLADINSFLGV
ncbi:MAG: sortase [Methanobacterium sp. BRmetb2]|jgi:LPXTG-site transpeptidase (sortase) family protein|nr:MAG: sortase [Methanobacterium sp. BRmetb2]